MILLGIGLWIVMGLGAGLLAHRLRPAHGRPAHVRDDGDGPRILYHSGSTLGFYAYVGLAPEARGAVAVLANSSDPTAAAIGARLIDALAEGSRLRP